MLHILAFTTFDTAALTALFWAIVFGLTGIALMVVGFKVFDWISPKIDLEKELAEKHNIAVAIVTAAMLIGIAIIIAAAMM